MAPKKSGSIHRNEFMAKLVTGIRSPCVFCQRNVDDEVIYGKLYAIGDMQCHYFCVLLSSCLVQRGKDKVGLFGFLYADIVAEVERSKKHRCSFCGRMGATLGCSISQCKKQFHLPCGRERHAVSLFYGNYKSFCNQHAPKQSIPDSIMANAKLRIRQVRKKNNVKSLNNISNLKDLSETNVDVEVQTVETTSVCVICYEEVEGYPTVQTFWPPCCARDAWFHRSCLQRMALSAGMHYLKCPLCNDKNNFYQAVVSQGYYVPDRDAAWELEQNAFAEIYERPISCDADECICPMGRNHDADTGAWDIKLCILCGSTGVHADCSYAAGAGAGAGGAGAGAGSARHVCRVCLPAAPDNLDLLADTLQQVLLSEQDPNSHAVRSGPVMPSRMSLRRTKQRLAAQNIASSSSSQTNSAVETDKETSGLHSSRQDLNLTTPRKPQAIEHTNPLKSIENTTTPIKLLQQGLHDKIHNMGLKSVELDSQVLDIVRRKFRKPKPLCVKKRIVSDLLDGLFDNLLKDHKQKEPVKEWYSPKKCSDEQVLVSEKGFQNTIKDIADILEDHSGSPKEALQDTFKDMAELLEDNSKLPIEDLQHSIEDVEEISVDHSYATKEGPSDDIAEFLEDNSKSPNEVLQHTIEDVAEILEYHSESPKLSPEKVQEDLDQTNVNLISDVTILESAEQIIEYNSDKSIENLTIFDTPKKLRTVDIQKDSSLEISANDEVIHIDVIKIDIDQTGELTKLQMESPVNPDKCAFKFSPSDKEILKNSNVDMDLESFKNQYLNEVDRHKCNFNHKHLSTDVKDSKIRTAIDFAVDASLEKQKNCVKRKLDVEKRCGKKRKVDNAKIIKKIHQDLKLKGKEKCKKKKNRNKDKIKFSVARTQKENKIKKKLKTELSIRNKNIQVKIKWKEEKLDLQIRKSKSKTKTNNMKQCVLQYYDGLSKDVIVMPEKDVTTIKRKYVKQEKTPDNLKQTTLQSFFKIKLPQD